MWRSLLLVLLVVEAEEEDRARPKNREMRLRRETWVVVELVVEVGKTVVRCVGVTTAECLEGRLP